MQVYDTGSVRRPSVGVLAIGLMALSITGYAADATAQIRFEEDVSAGLDFVHFAGFSANKYVPEVMAPGLGWLDFDVDGHWDLYVVDSGVLPGVEPLREPPPEAGANRLFRGTPTADLERVERSGLEERGYGMGLAAADYDNDGWVDVLVTNFEEDALFRNNGDGTFEDVSHLLPADGGWGASAAWGDLDGDGWLDLYVTNYLHYPLDSVPLCSKLEEGIRQYCPPQRLDGKADQLFHNRSGSAFTDVTARASMVNAHEGKGLGVVIVDLTGDGLPDVYVANDSTRNFFYANREDLSFEDVGLISGTGLNDFGQPQSGMGIDVGDLDGSPGYEIAVTNFILEPVNLYSPVTPDLYRESSFLWGVGEQTLDTVGFGVVFVDADSDGDLDIVVANGHILDDHPFFAQPNQVFRNERSDALRARNDPRPRPLFTEITEAASEGLARPEVSRGLAVADYDHDGRPDLALTNTDGPTRLFHNVSAPGSRRLVVRLRGRETNRDAVGASVRILASAGERPDIERTATVLSGVSYLSRNADDLYFGLADVDAVDLEISWPDGSQERLDDVAVDRLLLIRQGRGIEATRPLEEP